MAEDADMAKEESVGRQQSHASSSGHSSLTVASLISSEVRSVEAAMRVNARWRTVTSSLYADDQSEEDVLLRGLSLLRKSIFSSQTELNAIEPLEYLTPFLGIVLSEETSGPITGIALISLHKLLNCNLFGPETRGAKEAMQSVVDAVSQCRFEATDPASDEVVLSKILLVLVDCIQCPAGALLSDRNVCDAIQACFRIGHQTGKEGELLQRLSRSYVIEIVRAIFTRLAESVKNGASDAMDFSLEQADENASFGLPAAIEVLMFGISLLSVEEDVPSGDEMTIFGLMVILTSVECLGPTLEKIPAILMLMQDEMMRSMLSARSSGSIMVLSLTCSVFLCLYIHAREHLVVQLESFAHGVLLRLAEGKSSSSDQQLIALDSLIDLCRHPLFALDVYSTYDCAVESGNVFEDLCTVLSKTAFPVNVPLSRMHLVALDGLLAIVEGMAVRTIQDSGDDEAVEELSETRNDFTEYADIWKEIGEGPGISRQSSDRAVMHATASKRQKFIKRRLLVATDHFNKDIKKGFEFMQSINLLPTPLETGAVASFLRMTPGLDKNLVGEYLGDPKEFCVEVLAKFTDTFDFGHMELDMAMRTFLATFRLPGEAQKISRILEAFSDVFHRQSKAVNAGGEGQAWASAVNTDAIYILSYSVIMLNTDLHNKQVKKKMSLDEFIRNNRGTNEGKDWPRETLEILYESIDKYEIRMKDDGDALDITPGQWAAKLRRASSKQLSILSTAGCTHYDRDMFAILWGPTIAALSVVFDHAEDEATLHTVINGFLTVAKVASSQQLLDVMDNLIISLCKFSSILSPSTLKPSVTFGEDTKARMAVVAIFSLAHRYGDSIRSGWRNILDLILRMHKLGLIPEAENSESVDGPNAQSSSSSSSSGKQSSSIIGNASRAARKAIESRGSLPKSSSLTNYMASTFSKAFGLDSDNNDSGDLNEREREAVARTVKCIEECQIDDIFTESKFLEADALLQLVRALVLSAGSPGGGGSLNSVPVDEDTAVFCLGLLMAVTLRNRDRIRQIWDMVHDHLAKIMLGANVTTPLVEAAVLELLRLCQRLLPYKEEIAEKLVDSLQLVLKLNEQVAYNLAEEVMGEVVYLLKGSVTHIKTASGWRTVTLLLIMTSRHPEASALAFEGLSLIMQSGSYIVKENFVSCLDCAIAFVEAHTGGDQRSVDALELLSPMHGKLVEFMQDPDLPKEEIASWWDKLVRNVADAGLDGRPDVRDTAIVLLARALVSADALALTVTQWQKAFDSIVFPLLAQLVEAVRTRNTLLPDAQKTLRAGVALMCKAFLQPVATFHKDPAFLAVWKKILNTLGDSLKAAQRQNYDELLEAVLEALKNMLLVLSSEDILVEGSKLWDATWSKVKSISPDITEELLLSSQNDDAPRPAAASENPQTAVSASNGASSSTLQATSTPAEAIEAEEDLT